MATWTPIDRDTMTVSGGSSTTFAAGNTSNDFTIKSGTLGISSGAVCGVQVTANASNGAGHFAHIKMYTEAAKTNLFYETKIDFEFGSAGSDTLAMPLPAFSTPTYTLSDISGGGGKTYTVQFLVQVTG